MRAFLGGQQKTTDLNFLWPLRQQNTVSSHREKGVGQCNQKVWGMGLILPGSEGEGGSMWILNLDSLQSSDFF